MCLLDAYKCASFRAAAARSWLECGKLPRGAPCNTLPLSMLCCRVDPKNAARYVLVPGFPAYDGGPGLVGKRAMRAQLA